MSTTKCLVLGGGGFLGRHLVSALEDLSITTQAVDRAFPPQPASSHSRRYELDLFSSALPELVQLFTGVDVVFHLAWSTIPATSEGDPQADLRDNLGLMLRLLQAARETGARLVFTSSGGTVYGRTSRSPVSEDQPLRPLSVYGATKAAAEGYASAFHGTHGVDVRIVRLANPFGAGQSPSNAQGAVTKFAFDALEGRPLEIWGDGEVVRDYIHVLDAVRALVDIGLANRDELGPDPTFNVGGGSGVSLNQLVGILEEEIEKPLKCNYLSGRRFDVPYNVLDIRKIDEILGWRPSLDLKRGIGRVVRDLREDAQSLYSSGLSRP